MKMTQSRKKQLQIAAAVVLAVLVLGAAASYVLTRSLSSRINDMHAGDGEMLAGKGQQIAEEFSQNIQTQFDFLSGVSIILTDATMRDKEKLIAAATLESLTPECTVYLIGENGLYYRLDESRGNLSDNDMLKAILSSGQNGLMKSRLPDGKDVLFLVKPTGKQSIKGFGYEAIGFGLPIQSAALLPVDEEFGGGNVFACAPDGNVLQAAQENALVSSNAADYFAGHGLDEAAAQALRDGLQARKSGSILFDEGNFYLYYTPLEGWELMLLTVTPDTALHTQGTYRGSNNLTSFAILVSAGAAAVFVLLVFLILMLLRRLSGKQKKDAFAAIMAEYASDLFIILDRKSFRVEYVSRDMELAFGIPNSYIQNNYHSLDACASHAILWPVTKLKRLVPGTNVKATEELINLKTKVQRTYEISAVRPKEPYDQYVMFVFSPRAKEAGAAPKDHQVEQMLQSENGSSLSRMFLQLQSPINAVGEWLALSKIHLENPEAARRNLEKAEAECAYLRSVVSSVVDLRGLETGSAHFSAVRTTLPEIVSEVLNRQQEAASAKQQIIRARCENVIHEQIVADKNRMVQLLEIILSNAVNYTPEGGNISFVAEEKPYTEKGEIVYEFRIKDNGIGMSEEFRRRIFEPFSRENSTAVNRLRGAGLGMALANGIVQNMNGRIIVNSQFAEGTQVTVTVHFETWQDAQTDRLPELSAVPNVLVVYEREKQAIQIVKSAVRLGCSARRCKLEDYYTEAMKGGPFTHVLVELPYRNDQLWREIRQLRELQGAAKMILYGRFSKADREQIRKNGMVQWVETPLFDSVLKAVLLGMPGKDEAAKTQVDLKQFAGKRVLFAGNCQHRERIEEMLSGMGMLVESISEGQQTILRLEAAPRGTYDLLLVDLKLPSLDGFQIANQLRKSERLDLQTLPVLGLSETDPERDRSDAIKSGMNDCIGYPISPERFFEAAAPYLLH